MSEIGNATGALVAAVLISLGGLGSTLPTVENGPTSTVAPSSGSSVDAAEHPWSSYDKWNIGVQALGAGASFLVALLAVFGDTIRRWIRKPQLKIHVGTKAPFKEIVEKATQQSGAPTRSLEIRLSLKNSGRGDAINTKVMVEEIYQSREDKTLYQIKSFVPSPLIPTHGSSSDKITPLLPVYFTVAHILEKAGPTERTGPPVAAEYTLSILVGDPTRGERFIEAGKGTIIVPVIVLADNVSSRTKTYIKIHWGGAAPHECVEANFHVAEISEAEFLVQGGGSR